MTESTILTLTAFLLAVSIVLQSLEIMALAPQLQDSSPWAWKHLKNDFKTWPRSIRRTLDRVYDPGGIKQLLFVQMALAFLLAFFPHALWIAGLMITCFLVALRFRGIFNGGSDYMTMSMLLGLGIGLLAPTQPFQPNQPPPTTLGFYFMALTGTYSYFVAGVVKLRNPLWRGGTALRVFLTDSNYSVLPLFQQWASQPKLMILASWAVISWECAFPLVWFKPTLTLPFLMVAFLFHLGNFWVFGLNRFVFAWMVFYPSLYFATQRH